MRVPSHSQLRSARRRLRRVSVASRSRSRSVMSSSKRTPMRNIPSHAHNIRGSAAKTIQSAFRAHKNRRLAALKGVWIPGNANLRVPGSGTRNTKFHVAVGTGRVRFIPKENVRNFLHSRPQPGERNLHAKRSGFIGQYSRPLYAWKYVFNRDMKVKGVKYIMGLPRKNGSSLSPVKEESPLKSRAKVTRRNLAATRIQSAFRGYKSRKPPTPIANRLRMRLGAIFARK
jgi:hypothetical protein